MKDNIETNCNDCIWCDNCKNKDDECDYYDPVNNDIKYTSDILNKSIDENKQKLFYLTSNDTDIYKDFINNTVEEILDFKLPSITKQSELKDILNYISNMDIESIDDIVYILKLLS